MADDTSQLRSAFLLEHMNVECPDLLLRSSDYSWKIHHKLLYCQTRATNLVKDASTRDKSATKSADMGSRDPWMVARLVQFLYTRTYDVHYMETCDPALSLECSLENILYTRRKKSPKIFAEDREKDQSRSEVGVHLMMCELARMYEMPALIDHAIFRAFQNIQGENAAEDLLKAAASIMGIHAVCKSDELRKLFATFIAEHRKHLSEDMVRQWLRGDGTFAIEVVDCCLAQNNSASERHITAIEAPPNLKKRRPSI